MLSKISSKTVYVGLSGGVDSSVCAYLLKQKGYNVIGTFIRGWQPNWLPCTWKEDRISAMRTAAYLDIPFITLDLEKEYKEKIVDYMLDEYANGKTPNGDMLCNREIKFGLFLDYAMKNGADFVATGHYARKERNSASQNFALFEAENKDKDQSYFLSQISQKQLDKILFPLGNFKTKNEVRDIAEKAGLPVATRKDSVGMCFVGNITMKDFLKNELSGHKNLQIGKIINDEGNEIGEHEGVVLYTIGERHGFKIYPEFQTTENKEMYVIKKDLDKNILYVSVKMPEKLRSNFSGQNNNLKLEKLSFINETFKTNDILQIRIRYRGEKINVRVVDFNEKEKTCQLEILEKNVENKNLNTAAGQFGVFYIGEKVLGGGVFV
jgi:tRNA-specific 2-thiouridylase